MAQRAHTENTVQRAHTENTVQRAHTENTVQRAQSSQQARARAVAALHGGEQGMILIVVLVMIAVLAAFGSAASMRTAMDLREGSAQRVARAAYRVSETGTMASVSLAGQMQAGFADYIAAKNAKTLTMSDMGANLLANAKDDNSFGNELTALGGMDFATVVEEADSSANVPGYDAGRFCFRTFRMVTTSRIGAASPETTRDKLMQGETAMAAVMTVGPAPCGN